MAELLILASVMDCFNPHSVDSEHKLVISSWMGSAGLVYSGELVITSWMGSAGLVYSGNQTIA